MIGSVARSEPVRAGDVEDVYGALLAGCRLVPEDALLRFCLEQRLRASLRLRDVFLLVVREEEHLVANDRAADIAAEVVAAQLGSLAARERC